MIVYRLSAGKFKNDLSGKGAELAGGRWNSKGVAMLYTSASVALCLCELAVHIPFGIVPKDYHLLTIEFPDNSPPQPLPKEGALLPKDWRSVPHSQSTQDIGDKFIAEGKLLVLKVPSAIVPADFNFLFNPKHKDFSKVKIKSAELFEFDSRIFKGKR
jgi:RES domain-containing protein